MPRGFTLFRLLAVVCVCVTGLAAGDAGNWPRFRGPNGTGIAEETTIPVRFSESEGLLWKVPIPGGGNSSPVVWGRHLFLQTSSDDAKSRSLLCLDAETGKVLWMHTIPGQFVKFRQESSHASATPATDGEFVFNAFWDGKDITLKGFTVGGQELWSKNLGEFTSQHGPGHSPVPWRDRLFFVNDMDAKDAAGNPVQNASTLYCFDKKTGNVLWQRAREAYRTCYSAPFILERPGAAGPELVVTSTTAITGYDPDSGKIIWEWKWSWSKNPLRTVASSVAHNGMFFACSGDGGGDRNMVALRLPEGATGTPMKIWENKKNFPYVPVLLTRGDYVYQVNDRGLAGCFEAATGKQMWFERLPDTTFFASPILVGDRMYAGSEQGDVFVFAAEPSYQLLAQNSIGERIRATPAVANGRLYVRGQYHLFCFGNKN